MKNIPFQIHKLLIRQSRTLAIAESCTGGLLSSLLTRYPGCSKYLYSSLVVYSNRAKEKILNIPARLILKKGAVSADLARKMAESARKLAGSDFGVGITGIAGPTGATAKKPVGTVFIAVSTRTRASCRKFNFKGSRLKIQRLAAINALLLLKSHL